MKNVYLYIIFILFFTISFCQAANAQDECDLSRFVTYTKGGWGSDAHSNNPGSIRDSIFPLAFPQGLTVGGTLTIKLTSSSAAALYLRSGGTPGKLLYSYVDPSVTESGNLGVQLVALQLNISNDLLLPAKPVHLTDLIITQGKFQGKTVAEFFALANAALGGADISGMGFTYSDLNDAAAGINENFDDGTQNNGFLACPEEKPPLKASIGDYVWVDLNNNGIQDDGATGVQNVTVQLYDCSGQFIRETTTDSQGYYFFKDVPKGNYYVKVIPPYNYSIGKINQGTNDAIDSDFRADGQTECFDFDATADNYTIDCALVSRPDTDLEIVKTASKTNVKCDEVFSYTIRVKNNGPLSASEIVITDILPEGVDFVSSTASQGAYDENSGKWIAGSLEKGQSAALNINVKADCSELKSNLVDLGAAKGFNVFVLENMTQPSADTQGKVAVGGNATLSNYSVGDLLPPNSGDVLIVGGNLVYTSGSINNGNAVYGGTTNLPQYGVSITGGTLRHDIPVDFQAAGNFLKNLSHTLLVTLPNGSTRFEWGSVTLKGTDPLLNVFTVSGGDLSSANNFVIDVPKGSSVLVNISGLNVSLKGGMSLTGAAVNSVIYNFFQAQSLSIFGMDLRGTVLAPLAAVDFKSGIVTGQLIAKSVTGSGQFNNDPWDDGIPGPGSFTNTASLSGSIPPDSKPENNSSSVTVYAGLLSSVRDNGAMPSDFILRQNYPNPFNPSTSIEFAVPEGGRYSIKIFNMLGQEVATVLNQELPSGYHKTVFNASMVPSGIYFYRLEGINIHLTRKMILTK
jgi:choice-of-anchor A domain-containing protein/uncharacterized repeat protein (TIGR01451 family)